MGYHETHVNSISEVSSFQTALDFFSLCELLYNPDTAQRESNPTFLVPSVYDYNNDIQNMSKQMRLENMSYTRIYNTHQALPLTLLLTLTFSFATESPI